MSPVRLYLGYIKRRGIVSWRKYPGNHPAVSRVFHLVHTPVTLEVLLKRGVAAPIRPCTLARLQHLCRRCWV